VVAELGKLNPDWRVASMKWMRAVEAPEQVEGTVIPPVARGGGSVRIAAWGPSSRVQAPGLYLLANRNRLGPPLWGPGA